MNALGWLLIFAGWVFLVWVTCMFLSVNNWYVEPLEWDDDEEWEEVNHDA